MMDIQHRDRSHGVHVAATRGSGKSRFLGRYLAFSDFLAGIPTIVIDNGDTIDNILDRITRLPDELQKLLWPRVRYVDLVGSGGRIVPFPLYYRLGRESELAIAARFVQTILKVDPELRSASVQGKTAIVESGYMTGVELVQKGWQVSEIEQLKTKIAPTYRVRLLPMLLDDTQRAMYCATKPGIDWHEVVAKQQLVLINYQYVEDPEFLLSWILHYLLTFMQARGTHQSPISLVIDELYAFQASQAQDSTVFFKDLNVLINTIMRRYNLWLTVGLQDIGQFVPEIQDLLLTLGTQLIGHTRSVTSARKLATYFHRYDPDQERLVQLRDANFEYYDPPLYSYTTYSMEHQLSKATYLFMDELPEFTFIAKMRDGTVAKVSYADYEKGIYPRPQIVARCRDILMERDAPKVETILAEIAARIPTHLAQPVPVKSDTAPVQAPPLSPSAIVQALPDVPSSPPARPKPRGLPLKTGDEVE